MLSLYHHRFTNILFAVSNDPLLVLPAGYQQLFIQFLKVCCNRYRNKMIAPKISYFAFNSAFLMRALFAWPTKFCFKLPMRTKGDKSCGFFSPVSLQYLFHCRS